MASFIETEETDVPVPPVQGRWRLERRDGRNRLVLLLNDRVYEDAVLLHDAATDDLVIEGSMINGSTGRARFEHSLSQSPTGPTPGAKREE